MGPYRYLDLGLCQCAIGQGGGAVLAVMVPRVDEERRERQMDCLVVQSGERKMGSDRDSSLGNLALVPRVMVPAANIIEPFTVGQ